MTEKRVIRAAFLISFTGHFLFISAPGFNLRLPYQEKKQEKKPDEIMVNLEVERQALLPKIDTLGQEKKIKEVKDPPKPQVSKQQLRPEETAVRDTSQERPEEKIKVINPEDEAMLRYQDMVKQRIEEARRYPPWAKKQRIEGVVYLNFVVLPDGESQGIRIIRSSGSKILDEEAVTTIKRAGPFPPIPKEINISFAQMEVSIFFTLK